jgi:hypothetical protein
MADSNGASPSSTEPNVLTATGLVRRMVPEPSNKIAGQPAFYKIKNTSDFINSSCFAT